MKYFRVSTFITINALLFYLIWVSMISNSLMIHESDIQNTPQTLPSDPISFSISNPNTRIPTEATILPKTNMTVNQYISGQEKQALNLEVQSLNTTHWFCRSEYTNVSGVDTPFDSIISRDSINHYYIANNYWDWRGIS